VPVRGYLDPVDRFTQKLFDRIGIADFDHPAACLTAIGATPAV